MDKVKDIMSKHVITVSSSSRFSEALEKLMHNGISSLPVLEDDKLIGIVSEHDILRFTKNNLNAKNKLSSAKISSLMKQKFPKISPDSSIENASYIMRHHRVKHLPVVEHDGLVGIITQSDITEHSLKMSRRLKSFNFHQNIQISIMLLFIIFVIVYFLYKVLS